MYHIGPASLISCSTCSMITNQHMVHVCFFITACISRHAKVLPEGILGLSPKEVSVYTYRCFVVSFE